MSRLIDYLKSFNRKERFILLEKVLGQETFQLSGDFRDELKKHLKLHFDVPKCAYVAMDYHIDWIQMAIHLTSRDIELSSSDVEVQIPIADVAGINKNQRDVDLLVAFPENYRTHIVLVEAKADMPWDYDQLDHKVEKLRSISPIADCLELHFVLMSPTPVAKSKALQYQKTWPRWMKGNDDCLNYIQFDLDCDLRKITRRRNKGSELPDGEYDHYSIRKVRSRNPKTQTC